MDVKTTENAPFMENFISQMRMINERLNSLQQRNFELSKRSGAYETKAQDSCEKSKQDENNIKGCLINEMNQIIEYLYQLEERTSELENFL